MAPHRTNPQRTRKPPELSRATPELKVRSSVYPAVAKFFAVFAVLGVSLSCTISVAAREIQLAAAPVGFDVGINTSITFSFVVAAPTILHVELTGETQKRVSGGYTGRPEIELLQVDSVLPQTVPAWPTAFGRYEAAASTVAVYLLDGGRYHLVVRGVINGWSSSVNFENDALTLILTTDVSSYTPPPWLPLINQWLADVDLDDKFRVVASSQAPDYSFGEHVSSDLLVRVLIQARATSQDPLFLLWELMEHGYEPPTREDADEEVDGVFVFVSTQLDRDMLLAFEYEFLRQHSQEFWARLFRKIALYAGVSSRVVFGYVPVHCDANYVFEVRPGSARRRGSVCMMAAQQREAPTWIRERLADAAASDGPISSGETFGRLVEEFLETQVDAIGGSLEFAQRDSTYVEAFVRGVRGWVIPGGREWEKVQLSFLLTGEDNSRVFLFVDGMTSSGRGTIAPPDSRFRYAREPEHSASLTGFARAFLDEFLNQAEVN